MTDKDLDYFKWPYQPDEPYTPFYLDGYYVEDYPMPLGTPCCFPNEFNDE